MTGKELKNLIKSTDIELNTVAEKLNITPQALNSKLNSTDLKLSFIVEVLSVINKSVYDVFPDANNIDKVISEPYSNYTKEVEPIIYTDETEVLINSHGNKFFINPNGSISIEVPKIPFPAYASYVEVYNDETKIKEEFETITFKVDHVGSGNYLGFTTQGDSMNGGAIYDTPEGADVLGREIGRHLWCDSGFRKTKYGFILVTKNGIYHKDIKNFNCTTGNALLSSRNEMHKEFSYPINDIYQIFHVIKRLF